MPKKKAPETAGDGSRTALSPEGFFEPFNIDAVPWRKLPGSTAFKRLGRYGGGSQVGVGIDMMKPGQYSNRFHYHLREEEHIFILKGSATLILGNRRYVMNERDYCCFDDVACFPESGKARIRATGKMVPITEV